MGYPTAMVAISTSAKRAYDYAKDRMHEAARELDSTRRVLPTVDSSRFLPVESMEEWVKRVRVIGAPDAASLRIQPA